MSSCQPQSSQRWDYFLKDRILHLKGSVHNIKAMKLMLYVFVRPFIYGQHWNKIKKKWVVNKAWKQTLSEIGVNWVTTWNHTHTQTQTCVCIIYISLSMKARPSNKEIKSILWFCFLSIYLFSNFFFFLRKNALKKGQQVLVLWPIAYNAIHSCPRWI